QLEGSNPETVGGGTDREDEPGIASRRAPGAVHGAIALLAGRRSRSVALSVRALLRRSDAERDLDDMAARPYGPPHLLDRQAFEEREAVLVRRVDRSL